jgi:hypothetical protein
VAHEEEECLRTGNRVFELGTKVRVAELDAKICNAEPLPCQRHVAMPPEPHSSAP